MVTAGRLALHFVPAKCASGIAFFLTIGYLFPEEEEEEGEDSDVEPDEDQVRCATSPSHALAQSFPPPSRARTPDYCYPVCCSLIARPRERSPPSVICVLLISGRSVTLKGELDLWHTYSTILAIVLNITKHGGIACMFSSLKC